MTIAGSFSELFAVCENYPDNFKAYASTFKRLSIEASALIDHHFGPVNNFSQHLWPAMHMTQDGYLGRDVVSLSYEANQVIFGAINHLRRERLIGRKSTVDVKPTYVDVGTIAVLGSLADPRFDFTRLVQMCRELNVAHQQECNIAVAMLVRAVMDHIPPIFGKTTFAEVANSRPKSLKETLQPLESIRKIADTFHHVQIRKSETIPTATAVNASNAVESLLQEIIRTVRETRA
ncbi:hypothetical protein EOC93_25280 [Mesorhizobium sp. M6A.T.Ce.TU.002.03.1.1]|uniref:hypothetical protein n=1 Tax=Mesorhizobium sp. M6A.T.Ce.TU.002.03.1.1 TaxID=2496782 RepID=UPI000FCB2235|nr:hypothetical protein [Mesorhizobium sp. M6A.T.Ce.TU.002.03.1.1]RUU36350.1 hypothetical protein EOC93_25280 [Mesorhizobium sp. M6A.T.Ce.TU.002.03.1.1]